MKNNELQQGHASVTPKQITFNPHQPPELPPHDTDSPWRGLAPKYHEKVKKWALVQSIEQDEKVVAYFNCESINLAEIAVRRYEEIFKLLKFTIKEVEE